MAQPNILFIEGQGGLGRPLPNTDHISGLVFYSNTLPSGFTSANNANVLYQVSDAIKAGILNDYSDATPATATYLITALGAIGNSVELVVNDLNSNSGNVQSTSLGIYVRKSTDTTINILATSLTAFINSGTNTHGYSATNTSATITITAPKAQGLFLNSGTPLNVNYSGTIAGTITQFSGGVASKLAIYYYHISEFFRIQPKGFLYVGFYSVPTNYDFSEISSLQNFATGAIMQVGVYKDGTYSTTDIQAINTICQANKATHKPLIALYAGNLQAITDITTLTDLSVLNSNLVTNVIGQDAGGVGNFLYKTNNKTISCLGTELGMVAQRKVSESIAWVEVCNVSNGTECEVIGFGNGQLYTSINDTSLDILNSFRHTFLKKFTGYNGSYFNDSHTCTLPTSDYCQIENNRTIIKAERVLYLTYLPKLSSPIMFNKDGTLTDVTVASLETLGESALDNMIRNNEISAKKVTIDPTQNVLATSILNITVSLVINGVARYIVIPIGYKPSIN